VTAGPVAQWSELAAHNRLVGGSSPPGPTNKFNSLLEARRYRLTSGLRPALQAKGPWTQLRHQVGAGTLTGLTSNSRAMQQGQLSKGLQVEPWKLRRSTRYLADSILGPRLPEMVRLMIDHREKSAFKILGSPDDLKLRHASRYSVKRPPENQMALYSAKLWINSMEENPMALRWNF
jgi:Protein of unknown function (DUF1810)